MAAHTPRTHTGKRTVTILRNAPFIVDADKNQHAGLRGRVGAA
ncbi:hypothetical protein ABZ769_33995 [Streptomyces olivoreticuli]